jgi:peptidyl-prolyl cis-trans isomerase B (cyclophilin B)
MADLPRVVLSIEQSGEVWGDVTIELDEAKAPGTVANFLQYVEDGYFNGTIFHRVIPTFMVQGGGYLPDFSNKNAGLRSPIECESKNGLKNERGAIAMARTADPHSATSQFFINVTDNAFLDYPGQDGWGYCVFGKVVEGMEVVDRIKDVPTQSNPAMGENSQPENPPVIAQAARA